MKLKCPKSSNYRVITLILILALLSISDIWLILQHVELFETSFLPDGTWQFLISVHLAFIIPIIMYTVETIKKNKQKKWATSIITLNVENLYEHANKANSMFEHDKKLDFNVSKGIKTIDMSIGDHLSRISDNIGGTITFTYAFTMVNDYLLTQDITEMLPALQKNLRGLHPFNSELLEENFERDWHIFYPDICKFCKYIIENYKPKIDNPGDFSCSFIKYSFNNNS